ncbi:hypothetical protein ACFE04_029530 [Oxalis oulophora]
MQNNFAFMYSSGSSFAPKPLPFADQSTSLYDFRLLMQNQQDMVNRHKLVLTCLRDVVDECDSLRQENATLRSLNQELNQHVSVLIQASMQRHFNDIDDDEEDENEDSPTSVIESGSSHSSVVDIGSGSMPKSISVRSNGYSKTGRGGGGIMKKKTHQPAASKLPGKQKVYVRGTKKEEEALELEVYNQGMFKTELCNKWQETGTCPYIDHCQFAHGVGELRPVIRHPRYKTEVCRMILAGDNCPYGHRCHFRHQLTDQERFTGHVRIRTSTKH